jgi:peptidyl-prolyl cis-trans isomerase SurA
VPKQYLAAANGNCLAVYHFPMLSRYISFKSLKFADYMNKILSIFFIVLYTGLSAQPQSKVIDEVIAVVGDNPILRSEIEVEYLQLKDNFVGIHPDSAKAILLNKSLMEKLMLFKAQQDSTVVSEERVEAELEKRLRFYIQKFGSEKNMEEYLGKTANQLKAEYRDKIRSQLRVQDVQQIIMKDVKVSPTEVRRYFNSLNQDSLPYYSAEVEVASLVRTPKITTEEKQIALESITDIRHRILNEGKDFGLMARLYSEDPGSAIKDGELGQFGRNEMVPEFEAAAFKLKPDSISPIIESKYGYHILKLIDRKGERINVRHILVKPKTVTSDLELARLYADSLRKLVMEGKGKFEDLVKTNSDDEENSKAIGGYLTDPLTGATRISLDQLDKDLYFTIENMKAGEVSEPVRYVTQDNTAAYRIIYLKNFWPPHKANLKDDYQKIQQATNEYKRQQNMDEWVKTYKKKAYVRVNGNYANYGVIKKWLE